VVSNLILYFVSNEINGINHFFKKKNKINNSLERSLMVPQGAEVVKIQKNRPDSNSIQSILKKKSN
jgi:hypothetical protein